jgi:hypothetical protein
MKPTGLFAFALITRALLAQPTCTVAAPCSFSINIPYDNAGQPDTRPGTWGTAASYSVPIPFADVPSGYLVRITRVYGDVVSWPHGQIAPGTFSGVLSGLETTNPVPSQYVAPGLGAMAGCFLYFQDRVGAAGSRIPAAVDSIKNGLLGPDNVLVLTQAVWLNETGVSIHMETTLVVEFVFEAVN